MGSKSAINANDLRDWLPHVRQPDTVQWLMLGIAYDQGVSREDLADWYGLDVDEVDDWLDGFSAGPLVVAIAEREGVNLDAIAAKSGLSRRTINDWFEALADQPVERAADIIHRYSQQRTGPLLSGVDSRVHYLDYEAVRDNG